jgi:predicted amidohydrolase YtcJ
MNDTPAPDLILHNGRFTTLDRSNPTASAVAVKDGRFTRVDQDADIVPLAGPRTRIIDLKKRCILPGLIDNHLHIIRGGLNFNTELRWDGVRSLSDATSMLKRQVGDHSAPAMGEGGGWFHRAPVRRKTVADDRRAERRCAGHARVPAASL